MITCIQDKLGFQKVDWSHFHFPSIEIILSISSYIGTHLLALVCDGWDLNSSGFHPLPLANTDKANDMKRSSGRLKAAFNLPPPIEPITVTS